MDIKEDSVSNIRHDEYRIDVTMNARNDRALKYLLAYLLFIVGLPLFVTQAFAINYNNYLLVVTMVCGSER